MAWGMSDNEKDKNGLKPTQKKIISDAWYNFLLNTNLLDQLENKPRGWSWFWGLYRLYNYPGMLNQPADFNLEAIRADLPTEHWLKDVDDSELNAILDKNDDLMLPHVQSLVDVFRSGMGITSTIYFYDLSFDEITDFSNLIFPLDVRFEKITFVYDVIFNNSIFLGNAYFIKADFPEEANFRNAVFHGKTAKFSGAVFSKIADFTNTEFKNYANFKGANFRGRTIFQQADFKLHAPRFYGAKFNNELILNRIELPESGKFTCGTVNDSYQKTIEASKDAYEDYQKTIEENKSAYETLIFLMEKQNKHHDKHRFFREEMRWRQFGNKLTKERRLAYLHERKDEYPILLRIEHNSEIAFFWLYDNISDYGYGIGRAFSWWFGHIFIGIIAIAIIAFLAGMETELIPFCSISVSIANANPYTLLGFDSIGLKGCYARLDMLIPIGFSIVKVTQTIISVALLFLLLTTLRVRFRLGGTTSNTTINNTTNAPSEQ